MTRKPQIIIAAKKRYGFALIQSMRTVLIIQLADFAIKMFGFKLFYFFED